MALDRANRLLNARTADGHGIRESDNAFETTEALFSYAVVCTGCNQEIDRAEIGMDDPRPLKGWFQDRDEVMYRRVLAHHCQEGADGN